MTARSRHGLTPVALCIPEDADTEILTLLEEHSRILKVVRRCADLVELEAAALAGIADIGVMSGSDPECDRYFIARLHNAGMRVILLQDYTPAGEAIGTHALMELGPDLLAPVNDPAGIVRALVALALPHATRGTDSTTDSGAISVSGTRTTSEFRVAQAWREISESSSDTVGEGEGNSLDKQAHSDASSVGFTEESTDGVDNEAGNRRSMSDEGAFTPSDHAWLNSAHQRPRRGNVIAIWGTSGAPGRTTVAINLAVALQRQPGFPAPRVIVIDADTYAPSIAHALGMGTEVSSLSALARHAARGELHGEHIQQALQRSGEGLEVITGLSSPHRWREAASSTLTQCLQAARECADYIVVDVAAGTLDPLDEFGHFDASRDEAIAAVLNASDIVALVARSDAEGLHRLMYALEWFQTHINGPALRIVANMVCEERAGKRPAQSVAQALSPYLPGEDISLITEDPNILKAQLHGCALITENAETPAVEAFDGLAHTVMALAARTSLPVDGKKMASSQGRHRKIPAPRMLSLAQSMRKRRKAQTRESS